MAANRPWSELRASRPASEQTVERRERRAVEVFGELDSGVAVSEEAEPKDEPAGFARTAAPAERDDLESLYRFRVRTIAPEVREKWIQAEPASAPAFEDTAPPPVTALTETVASRAAATLVDAAHSRPSAPDGTSARQARAMLARARRLRTIALIVAGAASALVAAALVLWPRGAEPVEVAPQDVEPQSGAPAASPPSAAHAQESKRRVSGENGAPAAGGTMLRADAGNAAAPGTAKSSRPLPEAAARTVTPAVSEKSSKVLADARSTAASQRSVKAVAQPKPRSSASKRRAIDIETPLFDD
jgi:hypothetical protein